MFKKGSVSNMDAFSHEYNTKQQSPIQKLRTLENNVHTEVYTASVSENLLYSCEGIKPERPQQKT